MLSELRTCEANFCEPTELSSEPLNHLEPGRQRAAVARVLTNDCHCQGIIPAVCIGIREAGIRAVISRNFKEGLIIFSLYINLIYQKCIIKCQCFSESHSCKLTLVLRIGLIYKKHDRRLKTHQSNQYLHSI